MPQEMKHSRQIAPHSLAVVLSHLGSCERLGLPEEKLQRHHVGYEIFADFKAENMQHFWNRRVTHAISETFFLGWIDEHVLLIQGKEEHLGVLREGWVRRSLKPPPGFTIKYLGDVSPISMSPISQSQFIPLGEILCVAISAMNSARKPVTQEALIEHLTTFFPVHVKAWHPILPVLLKVTDDRTQPLVLLMVVLAQHLTSEHLLQKPQQLMLINYRNPLIVCKLLLLAFDSRSASNLVLSHILQQEWPTCGRTVAAQLQFPCACEEWREW
uniref:Storkhead box 2 n=1 Tax=Xenopus tropicalis TaxID=8364 RepID=A0A6I8QLM2_XENTR